MNSKRNIVLAFAAGLALSACNTLVYDTEVPGECEVSVRFKYEYNMKYADAFANEVKSMSLYAFDPVSGAFVAKTSDAGEHIGENQVFTFPSLRSGTYDLVAWCGLEDSEFTLDPPATKEEFFCRMNARTKASHVMDKHLGALFYGYADKVDLKLLPRGSENTVVIPLIKNTNSIRVMLQALNSGTTLVPEEYDFIILDNNAVLNWKDEVPAVPVEVEYYPWDKRSGSVEYDDKDTRLTACVAEFTVNRLFKRSTDKARLLVVDKVTGTTVIDIPFVDYFLLVKGNYNRAMDDQEYLDRQDDYQITFFLDNRSGWSMTSGIFINGWHVVLMNTEF